MPQIIEYFSLTENTTLSLDFLYKDIILEEYFDDYDLGVWEGRHNNESITFTTDNVMGGHELILEMHFRYELEWNHDYFIIQYINGDFMIEIGRYNGDGYQLHTEFIPFTIPNEHEGGSLLFELDMDDAIDYRGVEIDYIKLMKGTEILANADALAGLLPDKYELRQNYPNPFNPTTNIEFFVPSLSHITLTLYNMKGEKIEDLVSGIFEPGKHAIILDGSKYASGMYFYRLKTENSILTKKIMFIK
jgi:hypothetical protein